MRLSPRRPKRQPDATQDPTRQEQAPQEGQDLPQDAPGTAPDARDAADVTDAADAAGDPGPEDPRRRAERLRRRRRLLLIGALPALLVTALVVWSSLVFGLTMAANRAYGSGDLATATSRYRTVASLNPWLEQWRVHYNLGTALLAAGQAEAAQGSLEEALRTVPVATQTDPSTGLKPAQSPECRVRYNLSLSHLAQARVLQAAGDEQGSQDRVAKAQEAAESCPPPEPEPDPSQTPSGEPTAPASQSPTPQESSTASQSPSPQESSSPGETSTPSPGQTSSAQVTQTPDDRAQRLRERNGEEQSSTTKPKDDSSSGVKPW